MARTAARGSPQALSPIIVGAVPVGLVASGSIGSPNTSGVQHVGTLTSFRESWPGRIADESASAMWRLHGMQGGGMALAVSGRCSRQAATSP